MTNIQHLQVIVLDKDKVTQRLVDVEQASITKRDLTLNKPLSEDRGLTETRNNTILVAEEAKGYYNEDFIEDIASSEVTIVDDMSKVNDIIE